MSAARTETVAPDARHRGPSLLVVAVVSTALFTASLLATAFITGGGHFPSPFESGSARFFSNYPGAVRVGAFLQFGAAVPLAIFAAAVSSRLRFLSLEVAGHTIALVGGALASAMAALSALLQWVLAQPGVATSEGVCHALHLLAFATGGPGVIVPFGLLVAGVSVSGGLARQLPRWVMWFGLLIAAFAELASLTLVIPRAAYFLPLARFLGLVWLIVVGAKLPVGRPARASGKRPGASSPPVLEGATQARAR